VRKTLNYGRKKFYNGDNQISEDMAEKLSSADVSNDEKIKILNKIAEVAYQQGTDLKKLFSRNSRCKRSQGVWYLLVRDGGSLGLIN
jgi:hypothetical protein